MEKDGINNQSQIVIMVGRPVLRRPESITNNPYEIGVGFSPDHQQTSRWTTYATLATMNDNGNSNRTLMQGKQYLLDYTVFLSKTRILNSTKPSMGVAWRNKKI